MSYRSWCFTLNNFSDADIEAVRGWSDVRRITVGIEVGESGTPHLQGAVTFCHPKRLSAVKKLIPRAHLEKMNAKDDKAFDYCRKEGNVCIDDDFRKKSNDKMNEYKEMIKAGSDDLALLEEYPSYSARYPGFAKRARMLFAQGKREKDDPPPVVIWLWGPSGEGKTRCVVEREENLDWVTFQRGSSFILGYGGGPAVLIDDFRADDIQFGLLLRLLDRYRPTVSVKGGEDQWAPRRIYITSPHPPEVGWAHGESVIQLTRRLTHVLHSDDLPEALQAIPIQGLSGNTVTDSPSATAPVIDLVDDLTLDMFAGLDYVFE